MIISETVDTENLQEQPTDIQPAEEQSEVSLEEQDVQLLADESQPTPTEEAIPDATWATPETIQVEAPVSEKTRDFVLGVEVILALSAIGAGLAWFYMRRSGG